MSAIETVLVAALCGLVCSTWEGDDRRRGGAPYPALMRAATFLAWGGVGALMWIGFQSIVAAAP